MAIRIAWPWCLGLVRGVGQVGWVCVCECGGTFERVRVRANVRMCEYARM